MVSYIYVGFLIFHGNFLLLKKTFRLKLSSGSPLNIIVYLFPDFLSS